MAVLEGAGAISSVGDRFCQLGTQPTKNFGPEKIEFFFENFPFHFRSQEPIFIENGAILAPAAPYGGRGH